jgi:hypothetical protein
MMTSQMDASLPYYAAHGFITDPGGYASRLDGLASDLPGLCHAVRGLVIHYQSDALGGDVVATRGGEVRTRTLAAMLARLIALDPRPLTIARPPEQRLVGCCRDAAVLVCAALRHRGVPARVRVGFARYLVPNLFIDHWVAECWNGARRRWILVDAEQDGIVRGGDGATFDPRDVPHDQFVVAGRAWQACRAGTEADHRFGYDVATTGMDVVKANVLHDLACLNKVELTPWDFWGLGLTAFAQLTVDDVALLDRVARLTQAAHESFPALRTLHERDARLRVPAIVTSYSLDDERMEVRIRPSS